MIIETGLLIITALCALANAWAAVADWVRADFVLANARALGLSTTFVLVAGLPKAAAAVGIGLGLVGFDLLGLAAAIGLVAFFGCALALHVYRGAVRSIAPPLIFELLAIGALIHFL